MIYLFPKFMENLPVTPVTLNYAALLFKDGGDKNGGNLRR